MTYMFRGLRVYQQALDFAERVSRFTSDFARPNWYLGNQFNRASLSIALNIAEGSGRASIADRRHFLIMARGSIHECVALCDMCERKNLLPDPQRAEFEQHLITIGKMLAGMMRRLDHAESVQEEFEGYGE